MENIEEVNELLEPKSESELKDEFLEEYRKLVMKYGYDFMTQPPIIVKVEFK